MWSSAFQWVNESMLPSIFMIRTRPILTPVIYFYRWYFCFRQASFVAIKIKEPTWHGVFILIQSYWLSLFWLFLFSSSFEYNYRTIFSRWARINPLPPSAGRSTGTFTGVIHQLTESRRKLPSDLAADWLTVSKSWYSIVYSGIHVSF